MARHEADREDLFGELAALEPRWELRVVSTGALVRAGQRAATGGWSIYFSPDDAYHFDSAGRLRRAYVHGHLYRTEGSGLARLTRERTPTETMLVRRDLSPEELALFLESLRAQVDGFLAAARAEGLTVVRSSPAGEGTAELIQFLDQVGEVSPPLAPPIRA